MWLRMANEIHFIISYVTQLQCNGTATQEGQFEPICGGGKLAQAAKDSQQETMHENRQT